MQHLKSSPINAYIVDEDLLRAYCKLRVYVASFLRFYVSSDHEKTLYSKDFNRHLRDILI